MTGKRQSNDNVRQARRSDADLGQEKAEVERASKEELRHMEGGDPDESARQRKAKEADLGQVEARLERASKEELRHMESDTDESQQKAKSQSK